MLEELRIGALDNLDYSSLDSNFEINALDEAQNEVCDELLIADPYILANSFDLTLDGSWRYYIPDSIPFNYETILMVCDITSGTTDPMKTIATAWNDRLSIVDGTVPVDRQTWSIVDNYIEFPLQPISETMRVWYTRRPVGFLYGTVAANAGSTDITFPATVTAGEIIPENDYYNGMKVYVAGQIRRITDYVASTKVATITPAWTTTPTTSSTMELISPLPERYHSMIVNRAIRKVLLTYSDDDSQILRKIEEDNERMKKRMGKRQKQTPELVRKFDRTD